MIIQSKLKKILIIVICVLLALPILFCTIIGVLIVAIYFVLPAIYGGDGKYEGDYPELYSVAINSILGAKGYKPDGHGPFPSKVVPIEKDSLGRVMFLYHEDNKISTYSLIINQKSDGEYTYYYSDYNFISTSAPVKSFSQTKLDSSEKFDASGDKSYTLIPSEDVLNPALKYFSYEDIEKLKKRNDWNMDIDIGKCEKAKIVRQKEKGPVRSWTVDEFYTRTLGDDRYQTVYITFSIKDNYNRSIYTGNHWEKHRGRRIYTVLFFQPDGSFDEKNGIMELTDLNNYQDDLKAFKELNNWNVKP